MLFILCLVSAVLLAPVIGTVRLVLTDGYRQTPAHYSYLTVACCGALVGTFTRQVIQFAVLTGPGRI